jgi:glutamate synthase (NADPH/NADH) small chain
MGEPGPDGRRPFVDVEGSVFEMDADLVLLAMGFLGPVQEGLLNDLGVKYTERGAIAIDENYMTSVPKVFAAGDMSRGASLVVWAIQDGRQAAKGADKFLMGKTLLT